MAGTLADLGDRFPAEARLRESEMRLRLAQDLSAIGTFDWDIAGEHIAWSDELFHIYGIEPSEAGIDYAAWRLTVLPEDLALLEDRVRRATARRSGTIRLDFRIRRPDGQVRQIECIAAFTYAPDGTPLRGIGVNRDTTETVRVMHALEEAEAHFRAVFDQAAVGVVDADLKGRWVRVNRRLAEMLGYDAPAGLLGRHWRELTHPDDRAAGEARLAELLAGQVSHYANDKRFLRKDGSAVWAHATVSLVRDVQAGRPAFVTGVIVAATERKAAAAALSEAEERLRLAQEAAGAGLWDLDLVTGEATCSEGYCRLYGLDPQGPGHRTIAEWMAQVHPEDRERAGADVQRSVAEGPYACEYRIVKPGGTVRWLSARGRTRFDEAGRPVRFTGLAADVTALRQSELRLRMAIEGTGLATWERIVPTGEATWSENHFALLGYPVDPAGRASYAMWRNLLHPDDAAGVDAAVAGCRDGERFGLVYRLHRADDGAERWMETIGCCFDANPAGVPQRMLGITLDVTEREISRARLHELQAELLHASRLADAGMMASGLAHELAQPLTAAASALQGARLVQQGTTQVLPAQARADLEEALSLAADQIARAAQILKGLRSFVAPQAMVRSAEALRPLVEDAGRLAMVGLGQSSMEIRNDVPGDLPAVLVDGVQVRQVLFNLLRNAAQAFEAQPTGGEPRCVRITAVADGDMAEVAVRDNGPGLPPEVAARLFEPFVTTKPEGMGIGLSICRSIVEAHGGVITAATDPSGGTGFRFTLPLAEAGGTGATEGRHHAS
jgi:two-component system sensor kinase FixL